MISSLFSKKYIRVLGIIIVALVIIDGVIWSHTTHGIQSDQLSISFLDIGQGDSILIQTPHGRRVLIDGGPDARVLSKLSEVLPRGDKTIDLVIPTHPDKDHIGGLVNVLASYDVHHTLESGVTSTTQTYQNLIDGFESEPGLVRTMATRGMRVYVEKNITLDVLSPVQGVHYKDTNDASVVVKLTYGDTTVMLTGDAPSTIEKNILSTYGSKPLESDILKVGHHGSKTSSSPEFVTAVHPRYAVISAGKTNRYGHPTQQVLDILKKANIKILGTYDLGTITFTSTGGEPVYEGE